MNSKTKAFYLVMFLAVAVVIGLALCWRDAEIAYHRNRMLSARRYSALTLEKGLKPSLFESLVMLVVKVDPEATWKSARQHEDALIKMGVLKEQEFTLTNRLFDSVSNRLDFHRQATNRFPDEAGWWHFSMTSSNKISMVVEGGQTTNWKSFIEEFDR